MLSYVHDESELLCICSFSEVADITLEVFFVFQVHFSITWTWSSENDKRIKQNKVFLYTELPKSSISGYCYWYGIVTSKILFPCDIHAVTTAAFCNLLVRLELMCNGRLMQCFLWVYTRGIWSLCYLTYRFPLSVCSRTLLTFHTHSIGHTGGGIAVEMINDICQTNKGPLEGSGSLSSRYGASSACGWRDVLQYGG